LSLSWAPWQPLRRRQPLEVLMPGSVLSVEQDLRDKTYKAGLISRALALFRVDRVTIFSDEETTERDKSLLAELLRYQVTPPHLKRKVFPLKEELKYAGLMPPLNLPNHRPPKEARAGAIIDGLVISKGEEGCEVFLGDVGTGLLRSCKERPGDVVTVVITSTSGERVFLERASWGRVYVGYEVELGDDLMKELERLRSFGFAVIGTSRYGSTQYGLLKELANRPLAVVIGGPRTGLLQYARRTDFDLVINTVPGQGTETVRSEEALFSTLALINSVLLA